ncbi:MAG: helix-turn-helix domain-containing protein [Halobacteriales archaeon]
MLYALSWDPSGEDLLNVLGHGGFLLKGDGGGNRWPLRIQFLDHVTLTAFDHVCDEHDIDFEVERLYDPPPPDVGEGYGLSTAQRETLQLAIRTGYLEIPCQTTSKELVAELGVSDQGVIERLRRAVRNLAENTILSKGREG